jgi:hypothetical protein
MSKYYDDKLPFNFFIDGDFNFIQDEIVEFCIKLLYVLFDRETPNIQIFAKKHTKENFTYLATHIIWISSRYN